jgi:radical SAM superfamily enzyme YgiQ (UPF0313 family)
VDDAFLHQADTGVKPFLQGILETGIKTCIHTPNGVHPRFIDAELAVLMKQTGFSTIRLAVETTDGALARSSSGKVDLADLERARRNLCDTGFAPDELGVYLLAGLPNQTPANVMESIRYVGSAGMGVYVSEYSPIPGTPAFDEARGIARADITEPLLQNNTLLACWHPAFPQGALDEIKDAARQTRKVDGPADSC